MKDIVANVLAGAAAALLLPIMFASAQTKSDTPTNPFANDPKAIEAGGAIFNGTCSACHGPGATGGRGPALNTGDFTHGGDDYDIFQTIRAGVPGTQMPCFSGFAVR